MSIKAIAADKNQFAGSHGKANLELHKKLNSYGYKVIPAPIPFGDYVLITDPMMETISRRGDLLKKMDLVGDIDISVDLKGGGLDEVAMNIQGNSHERFRDEAILAQKCGCTFYVLVIDEKIRSVNDVHTWKSKRKKSKVNPESLQKAMITMSDKYGIKWRFCTSESAGRAIIYLLTGVDVGK